MSAHGFSSGSRRWLLKSIGVLAAVGCVAASPAAFAASDASQDKIIVSGASGQLGELTVKELLKRGVPAKNLILVSRSPDKLQEFAKQGASVRFGDVDKPDSLPAAYAGGTKMLMISLGGKPGDPPRPPRHKIAFDAAVKAGVKYIVYTSFMGAGTSDSPLSSDHFKSEEFLKASGAKWTALRNGLYAEFVVEMPALKMAATGKATVDPKEPKMAPVTREDCAAAAAGALTTPGHENKVYDITGPELIDTKGVAKLVSEVTGKPVQVTEQAGANADTQAFIGNQKAVVTNAVQELAGRPATTMKAFLQADKAKLLAAK